MLGRNPRSISMIVILHFLLVTNLWIWFIGKIYGWESIILVTGSVYVNKCIHKISFIYTENDDNLG